MRSAYWRFLGGLVVAQLSLFGQGSVVVTAPGGGGLSPITPVDLPPVWPGDSTPQAFPPQLYGINGGGTVELGQKVTLTVLSYPTGEDQSYVWRKGDAVLPGATAASYVIEAAAPADAGTYTVTVTNSVGASVASTELTVKAAAAPVVVTSPANSVREVGQEAFFGYAATGSYPRTHQWRKNGVDIPGATGATYSISSVKTSDAGTYSVVITNSLGSATSAAASLTVNAASLPVLTPGYPADATAVQGGSAVLYASVSSGSQPLTFQWLKNGAALPGATASQLTFNTIGLADAGKYSVVVTNAAGSVTSREATIAVTPATPVSISQSPTNVAVFPEENASFSVQANGSAPMTFQWQKDGVPIKGATSSYFSIYAVKPADAASYTVVVSNILGSVTSSPASLTIKPPVAPAITTQPTSRSVTEGEQAQFSVSVSGTPPLHYRWYFNGAPLATAGSGSYLTFDAKLADAGTYYAVVSNAAGAVTSSAVTLNVKPLPPPAVASLNSQTVAVGQTIRLSHYAWSSSPITYQWYKDGNAIAGATSSSYTVNSATRGDAGEYFLVVSNAAGSTTSRTAHVTVTQPSTTPAGGWMKAERSGDIVYFAFTNPARIERFNLASETWLTSLPLSRAPTAFCVGPDALYLANGSSVSRCNLDGSNLSVLSTAFDSDVTGLAVWKGYLLAYSGGYAAARLTSIRLSDGAKMSSPNYVYYWGAEMAVATDLGRIYSQTSGISPSDITYTTITADGILGTTVDSPYHGDFLTGTRTYVFPGETYVADNGGTVYTTADFKFAGGLGGAFDDLAFSEAGAPLVLRGGVIGVYDARFVETTRLATGIDATRIFVRGENVFAFAQPPTGGSIAKAKLPLAQAKAPTPAAAVNPVGLDYAVDAAFLDKNDVLYLYSRIHRQLFRWSTADGHYLDSLPLQGWPNWIAYSATNHRVYLGYADARILQIKLDAGRITEEPFTNVPQQVLGMSAVGEFLFAVDPSGAWVSYFTYGADGRLIAQRDWSYEGNEYVWNPVLRRVYQFRDDSSPNDLLYTEINSDGTFGQQKDSPYHGEVATRYPIRVSADGGSILLGSGKFYDASTLQVNNSLGNEIDDARWVSSRLVTARVVPAGIELQRWGGSNYGLDRTKTLAGRTALLFTTSTNKLVVIAKPLGSGPLVTVLDEELAVAGSSGSAPTLTTQPRSQSAAANAPVSLSVAASSASGPLAYVWKRNGTALAGATSSSYSIAQIQPADAGIYTASVTGSNGVVDSTPAVVGVASTKKTIGDGSEVGPDILHPTGKTFDQVLLQGAAATVTADAGQVTRVSFIDLNDDIVQVEFSGAGTLSLVLAAASGPASPASYNQPGVLYMKGHAGIVISGANETTNVSVFTVGRATAYDSTGRFNFLLPISAENDPAKNGSALFDGKSSTYYDGVADIAFIAVQSENGKFGGIRAANAAAFATAGFAGVYAPGVQFTGPLFLGDIAAYDGADPVLVVGSATDARITGGDLAQPNGRPVQVSGIAQLKFVDGSSSKGDTLPARRNQARLVNDTTDVTDQIVVNPAP